MFGIVFFTVQILILVTVCACCGGCRSIYSTIVNTFDACWGALWWIGFAAWVAFWLFSWIGYNYETSDGIPGRWEINYWIMIPLTFVVIWPLRTRVWNIVDVLQTQSRHQILMYFFGQYVVIEEDEQDATFFWYSNAVKEMESRTKDNGKRRPEICTVLQVKKAKDEMMLRHRPKNNIIYSVTPRRHSRIHRSLRY